MSLTSQLLDLAVLALCIALVFIAWRLYTRMWRDLRRDAAELREVIADGHATQRAEADFLNLQGRRVECPVCGADRGEDCHRTKLVLRLFGPHPARLTAYRHAIR